MMRLLLSTRLPVTPRIKARPRFGAHGAYTSEETRQYEEAVATAVGKASGVLNYMGPVVMLAAFVVARPQRLKKGAEAWCDKRPDIDNYEKALLDAISMSGWAAFTARVRAELDATHKKGVASKTAVNTALQKRKKECQGFWRDDAQLVGSFTMKRYAQPAEPPSIVLELFDATVAPSTLWDTLHRTLCAI